MSKKRVSGAWVDDTPHIYNTSTDTFSTLPHEVIGDGTAISSYTIKGNMTQSGTPTPSNPVYPVETGDKTANLLCMKNGTHTYSAQGITVTVTDNNLATFSGTATAAGGRYTRLSDTFTLQAGTYKYRKYGTSTATPYIQNSTSGTILYSPFTISEPTDVFFGVNVVEGTNYTGTTMQVMLTDSNYDGDYEPYGQYKIPILSNGTTYPVYLAEPIRKIGDSVDTLPSTGTATRDIIKQIFTGDESVAYNSRNVQNQIAAFVISISTTGSTTPEDVISSHLVTRTSASETLNSGGIIMRSTGNHVVVGFPYSTISVDDNMTNAECAVAMKQYLADQYTAGTPVTVWYVLATAQTESFTAPTLPTSGTAQTFDVDTTLKPSEVNLTYHGWHEHSDEKYVGG